VIGRVAAVVLLLAGCAASVREGPTRPPAETAPAEEQEAARAYEELRRLDADLHAADAQAAVPDCARVGQLRDNICALAARICQIADGQPPGSPTAERCADAKTRCKNAVEQAQARGCPAPAAKK
jgi:hypothetical protein